MPLLIPYVGGWPVWSLSSHFIHSLRSERTLSRPDSWSSWFRSSCCSKRSSWGTFESSALRRPTCSSNCSMRQFSTVGLFQESGAQRPCWLSSNRFPSDIVLYARVEFVLQQIWVDLCHQCLPQDLEAHVSSQKLCCRGRLVPPALHLMLLHFL